MNTLATLLSSVLLANGVVMLEDELNKDSFNLGAFEKQEFLLYDKKSSNPDKAYYILPFKRTELKIEPRPGSGMYRDVNGYIRHPATDGGSDWCWDEKTESWIRN